MKQKKDDGQEHCRKRLEDDFLYNNETAHWNKLVDYDNNSASPGKRQTSEHPE